MLRRSGSAADTSWQPSMVIATLAEVARRDNWVRPRVEEGTALEIRSGRHPVIEPLLAARGDAEFVPNDTDLDADSTQILVLTGPNMSGKSTYLRQVALIVLLAQMGSFRSRGKRAHWDRRPGVHAGRSQRSLGAW